MRTRNNSQQRIYQTRQQRKQQETINTLINTLEPDSDTITSSEVSSDDNTESESSNGTEEDLIQSGGLALMLHSIFKLAALPFRTPGDSST